MYDRHLLGRRDVLRTAGAAVLAGAGAALTGPGSALAAERLQSLRSTAKSWLWAPEDFAAATGLFGRGGIAVEATATQHGANTPALIAGNADIVLGAPESSLQFRAQGQPVRMIAGFVHKFASDIVVKREILDRRGVSEASSVEEKSRALEGLKLGTTGPGVSPDVLFRYLLTGVGLEPDRDAQLVRIQGGGPGMLAAFSQGSIDGFCLSSPTSTLAVARFGAAWLFDMTRNPPPALQDYLYIVATTSERTIATKRRQLVAYIRGMALALRAIRLEQAAFRAWASEFFADLDPALFEQAYAKNAGIYMDTPFATEPQFRLNRQFTDIAQRVLGGEPLPDSVTFDSAWDLSLAREAIREL